MEIIYRKETDEMEIRIGPALSTISIEDLLEALPSQKVRVEYLLAQIVAIRRKRLKEIDDFMKRIVEITTGIETTRKKMQKIIETGEGIKQIGALSKVVTAYSSEKNVFREMRYAIKLLDNDEGKLLFELAKLEVWELVFHYDGDKTKEIEDKIIQRFEESRGPRNEVHLSDTCHCEMKCYNRLMGMEPIYTKKMIGILAFGEIAGLFLQTLYPPEQCEYESSDIVSSHLDVYEDFKYPLEAKSSMKKIFKAQDVPRAWELQLMRYMAKHNADTGWLPILNLFTRQLAAFKKTMTTEERLEHILQMTDSKDRIQYAVINQDPSGLVIIVDECPGCFYKPSKKRRELHLGDGCPKYTRKKKKKS